MPTRVRGLHAQDQARQEVGPGQRVAVNLANVHHDALGRGAVLVRAGQWRPTRRFDARLRVLPGYEIGNRGALLAYLGTTEQPVRLRLLEGREQIDGGEAGTARVWLASALPLVPGDRFVLRDTGRAATVAGGEVLDVHPALPVAKARPDGTVERIVAERGWVEADELEAITGYGVKPVVGRWVVAPDALADARASLDAAVDGAGPLGAEVAALDERERALVSTMEGMVVERGRVTRAGAADPLAGHPWLFALEQELFQPPGPEGVPRAEVRELVRRGLVVEEDGCYFAVAALEGARQRVAPWLTERPAGIAMGELRDLLGTTRKFAVPLATLLDRRGVTVRRGDVRQAGRLVGQPVRPEPI
jgi:selenocysteine-specific elongation factor